MPRERGDEVMRTSLKNTTAASLAALAIGLAVVSPASAHSWHHSGFHGHHGFYGPGLALGVFGLAAGAIAASAVSEDSCVEYRPIYDRWGNYIGQQPINVCQ
jgi:hypothetical protein